MGAAIPIFIAALAVGAFANGFCTSSLFARLTSDDSGMCVQGYFIRARSLPRFWYYSFHYMCYQVGGNASIPVWR